MTFIFFVQCVIKQLLDSVFVISRIIKVSARVISLSLRLRLSANDITITILFFAGSCMHAVSQEFSVFKITFLGNLHIHNFYIQKDSKIY